MTKQAPTCGYLAKRYVKLSLPLKVLRSHAGYYIGTEQEGMPMTRESVEYFPDHEQAAIALREGSWTQKPSL